MGHKISRITSIPYPSTYCSADKERKNRAPKKDCQQKPVSYKQRLSVKVFKLITYISDLRQTKTRMMSVNKLYIPEYTERFLKQIGIKVKNVLMSRNEQSKYLTRRICNERRDKKFQTIK